MPCEKPYALKCGPTCNAEISFRCTESFAVRINWVRREVSAPSICSRNGSAGSMSAVRISAIPEFRAKLADSQLNLDYRVWVDEEFDLGT